MSEAMRHRNWRHRGLCHRGPAGHADVMKPIATPIIGGMLTSTIHVLVITPVIFYCMKRRVLRTGRLRPSDVTT